MLLQGLYLIEFCTITRLLEKRIGEVLALDVCGPDFALSPKMSGTPVVWRPPKVAADSGCRLPKQTPGWISRG